MNLRRVVNVLESFAPSRLSEKWDNVGVLVEPSAGPDHRVERLMLTNDLTEAVLDEGIAKKVNMIVSYHPPIFSAFKRLCGGGQEASDWKQRLIVRCVEHRIAVYSPHTAWDAAPRGVNYWLSQAFESRDVRPITTCEWSGDDSSRIVSLKASLSLEQHDPPLEPPASNREYDEMIKMIFANESLRPYLMQDFVSAEGDLLVTCPLKDANDMVKNLLEHSNSRFAQFLRISPATIDPLEWGMGRVCKLREELSLEDLVRVIKTHLNVAHVQVAIGRGVNDIKQPVIRRVALCAGSGASVLCDAEHCDVYWTGEMSHHEVLDAVAKGISVILCGHSNTERGFLTYFVPKLRKMLLDKVDVLVSTKDADPLLVI